MNERNLLQLVRFQKTVILRVIKVHEYILTKALLFVYFIYQVSRD